MTNSWQDVIKRINLSTLFDLCSAGIDQCKRRKFNADENIDIRRIIEFFEFLHAAPGPTFKMDAPVQSSEDQLTIGWPFYL